MCREHCISAQALYPWTRKYGGTEAKNAKRLRGLEEDDRLLKCMVADPAVDNVALKSVLSPKTAMPKGERAALAHLRNAHRMSERRACQLVGASRASTLFDGTTTRRCVPHSRCSADAIGVLGIDD